MRHIAINLNHVSKVYSIHHEKPTLLEQCAHKPQEQFTALHDISYTVKKGERLGIIGPNGSGKTTLLKLIAGITAPTSGTVDVHGNVVSLIDLEAGFHPDLTGYQNIFLNGSIIGMTQKKIMANIQTIIAFADIGSFIDVPLYTYSSGMKLRLGYAIAIHSAPDILLLDESLQVGDALFQKKCAKSLHTLIKKHTTIIVASHDLCFIKKICTQVIVLTHGTIKEQGSKKIITNYI